MMRTVFNLVIILFGFCNLLAAQTPVQVYANYAYKNTPPESSVLKSSDYRQVFDLNGEWQVRFGGDSDWEKIHIPSSVDYNGIMYFRKNFTLPQSIAKYHLKLCALGINFNCSIKINGVYIGSHSTGYTSFSFDNLETSIRPGEENVLEIEVDGRFAYESPVLPRPRPWGWKSYSGIVREIFILIMPKITITDWSFEYRFSQGYSQCNTVFKFLIQNFSQNSYGTEQQERERIQPENIQEVGYYVELFNEKTGTLVKSTAAEPKFINVHEKGEETLRLDFRDIELWSPVDPVRYLMKITLIRRNNIVIDRLESTFGFTDIQYKYDGLYLNGNKTELMGIYRIEQHPNFGISLPWEIQRQDLILIKNLGINTVRTGPYPNHPYFYEMCDELGLMVLEEISVSQVPDYLVSKPEFIDHARNYLTEMIERDRMHPSIIGWGIGSGLDVSSDNTSSYVSALTHTAKELDRRPVFYSSEIFEKDKCIQYADFKLLDCFNPSASQLARIYENHQEAHAGKPVFIGRIGTDVFPDNFKGYKDRTSLAFQAKYIREVFEFTEMNANVPGVIFWSFADWIGDVPVLASGTRYDQSVYYRGLVSMDRIERNPAYLYLKSSINQSQLTSLSMGYLPIESLRSIIFAGFGIIIALVVLLKQNRWFGQNFKRSLLSAKIFFEDVGDSRNINSWQTMILGLAVCSAVSIGIAGFSYFFKRNVYFDMILSQFFIGPHIKSFMVYIIWHPLLNILVTTFLFLCAIAVISLLFSIVLTVLGHNRGMTFTFNILIWAASHVVFLIPFSMAAYSLLNHHTTFYFYIVLGLLFLILYIYRLVIALKVTFAHSARLAILSLFIIVVFFFGGIAIYFESSFQSFTYVNYYMTIVQSQK